MQKAEIFTPKTFRGKNVRQNHRTYLAVVFLFRGYSQYTLAILRTPAARKRGRRTRHAVLEAPTQLSGRKCGPARLLGTFPVKKQYIDTF